LSYVIQNFYKPNPTFRLSSRKYYNWLYANNVNILNLIFFGTFLINDKNFNLLNLNTPSSVINFFFPKSLFKLFSKTSLKWSVIFSNTYIKSLEYWSYKTSLQLLDKNTTPSYRQQKPSNILNYNLYFVETRYVSTSFFNRYYSTVLSHFLYLSIKPWQVWKSTFNNSYGFMVHNNSFHMLRYFNTNFFKIHSV